MSNFFDKEEFLKEMRAAKKNKVLSDSLTEIFIDITRRRLNCNKYKNLTEELREEAFSFACFDWCRYWKKYDLRRNTSPFSWLTQFSEYGVRAALKKYKREYTFTDRDGNIKWKYGKHFEENSFMRIPEDASDRHEVEYP